MDIYTSMFWFKGMTWASAICYIILVIGLWKVFEKAGEEGWKALIPFYNFYILFKISGMPMLFWLQMGCTAVAGVIYFVSKLLFFLYPIGWIFTIGAFVIQLLMWTNLSKAFGHGLGYAIGLWLLNPVFIILLGFGSSRYWGNPLQY